MGLNLHEFGAAATRADTNAVHVPLPLINGVNFIAFVINFSHAFQMI